VDTLTGEDWSVVAVLIVELIICLLARIPSRVTTKKVSKWMLIVW